MEFILTTRLNLRGLLKTSKGLWGQKFVQFTFWRIFQDQIDSCLIKKVSIHPQYVRVSVHKSTNHLKFLQIFSQKNYRKWDWISISRLSWCSRWLFWSWDLNNTLRATMNLLCFSRDKYTLPNFPRPRGRPISKLSKVHLWELELN